MARIVKWFGRHADAGLPSLQSSAREKVLFEVLRGNFPGAQTYRHDVDDEGDDDQYVDGVHWIRFKG